MPSGDDDPHVIPACGKWGLRNALARLAESVSFVFEDFAPIDEMKNNPGRHATPISSFPSMHKALGSIPGIVETRL